MRPGSQTTPPLFDPHIKKAKKKEKRKKTSLLVSLVPASSKILRCEHAEIKGAARSSTRVLFRLSASSAGAGSEVSSDSSVDRSDERKEGIVDRLSLFRRNVKKRPHVDKKGCVNTNLASPPHLAHENGDSRVAPGPHRPELAVPDEGNALKPPTILQNVGELHERRVRHRQRQRVPHHRAHRADSERPQTRQLPHDLDQVEARDGGGGEHQFLERGREREVGGEVQDRHERHVERGQVGQEGEDEVERGGRQRRLAQLQFAKSRKGEIGEILLPLLNARDEVRKYSVRLSITRESQRKGVRSVYQSDVTQFGIPANLSVSNF
jgi:hypothetical protein